LIGERDRAAVLLGPNASAMFVDIHHRRTGGEDDLGQEGRDLAWRRQIEIEWTRIRTKQAQGRIPFLENRSDTTPIEPAPTTSGRCRRPPTNRVHRRRISNPCAGTAPVAGLSPLT